MKAWIRENITIKNIAFVGGLVLTGLFTLFQLFATISELQAGQVHISQAVADLAQTVNEIQENGSDRVQRDIAENAKRHDVIDRRFDALLPMVNRQEVILSRMGYIERDIAEIKQIVKEAAK